MLVTKREDIYNRVQHLRDHGRPPNDKSFRNEEVAYKYKMSGLQAALGLAQIERIEELVARKREIFAWYRHELEHLPGLRLNREPPGTRNSYWMVTVIADEDYGFNTKTLQEQMNRRNIDCRPFFYPLSSIPAYRDLPETECARRRNTISYRASQCGLNLPSAPTLTQEQVIQVCTALRSALGVDYAKV